MLNENKHTLKRYDKDLDKLKGQVERMGNEVSRQMDLMLGHLDTENDHDFEDVIDNDLTINNFENKANKTVIKLLAKRSPMGRDLRIIVGFSRMINDLERIGDELVNMARTLQETEDLSGCQIGDDIITLSEILAMAMNLLDRALLAAQNDDIETARDMLEKSLNKQSSYKVRLAAMIECIMKENMESQKSFNAALQSNSLKRICDHICNICQHTVFMVSGEDLNHQEP